MPTIATLLTTSAADVKSAVRFIVALPLGVLLRRRHRDMWLISERADEARDNGYWLFAHLCERQPERRFYYVIYADAPDAERIRRLDGDRLIAFGSLRHYVYYVAARVHITAHAWGGMPDPARVTRTMERSGLVRNTKVFIQHGVVLNALPYAYRDETGIDLVCCTTEREMQFILDTFGYHEGQVALTGLCRFDQLLGSEPRSASRTILLLPTWRIYLADVTEDTFLGSTYYRELASLVTSSALAAVLDAHGCRLVFHLHPGMQKFLHLFPAPCAGVEMSSAEDDIQELLKEASLFITDYSSTSVDFAYMRRPVIYHQFDDAEFRQGHWAAGYFDYGTDGFGPITHDASDLIGEIERTVEAGFVMDRVHRARVDAFFTFRDTDNCARTYEAVRSHTAR